MLFNHHVHDGNIDSKSIEVSVSDSDSHVNKGAHFQSALVHFHNPVAAVINGADSSSK